MDSIYGKKTQQAVCVLLMGLMFLVSCSSRPTKKERAARFQPQELKLIESVRVVRDLFDVVGCFRVGPVNVELEGEERDYRGEYIRKKAAELGADTVNEIRYFEKPGFSKEAVIVGEAYRCRKKQRS